MKKGCGPPNSDFAFPSLEEKTTEKGPPQKATHKEPLKRRRPRKTDSKSPYMHTLPPLPAPGVAGPHVRA